MTRRASRRRALSSCDPPGSAIDRPNPTRTRTMNEMSRISAQPAYSEGVQSLLKREPALFINGEWVRSTGDKTYPVYDPSTGRQISSFVDASDEDVDRAAQAARTAFDDGRWSGLSPYQRERMINRLADLIEANIEE